MAALEKDFKDHEKNPEKHPHYSEEWKRFWSRRYKELQASGQDASKVEIVFRVKSFVVEGCAGK